jgi:hypothetical protein
MATSLATGRLTNSKRGTGEYPREPKGLRPLTLEAVSDAIERTTGKTVRRDRLERDDRAYRWCVRVAFAKGGLVFNSTIAQAARGMGYETTGDKLEDRERWNSTVHRALNSLEAAGLIQWGGVKRPNGQWRCIQIRMVNNRQLRTIMVVM